MFEDTNFDLDDDAILGTSFTPAITSTQSGSQQKRLSQEIDKDNLKKLKLSNDELGVSESVNVEASLNKSPKKIIESFTMPNRIVKRRFPGPAGLLPERISSDKSTLDFISDKSCRNEDVQDHMLLCSQQTVSVFEDGPWQEMVKDYYVSNDGECLYKKFNISWIKKQANLKKLLVNHKAPFLASVIQSLEIFDGRVPTVNVTLKDATGDIQGTVLHSLYEEFSDFFTTGSVLVLKQFGVLSAGFNNHCLTITPNNLVAIYCLDGPKKPRNDKIHVANASSVVKKVVIQKCTVDEIVKKYNEDVLANQRKENSEKVIDSRCGSLVRSGSGSGYNKIQHNNSNKDFVVPRLKNCFNETSGDVNNKNVPLETLSKIILSDDTKKTFNFKRTSETSTKSKDLDSLTSKKDSSDTNCDIVVSSRQSRISVKSENKEHTEIWRDLLEDVDADSLFDDF